MKTNYLNFKDEIPTLLKELQYLIQKSNIYRDLVLSYDFSVFDKVESFYLDVIDGKETIHIPQEEFKAMFYAYIGETFRHHLGGEWVICSVKNDDAFGTPIILNWGKKGSDHVSISPYVWEIILVRDREKGDISQRILRAIERENKKYSGIF